MHPSTCIHVNPVSKHGSSEKMESQVIKRERKCLLITK